MLITVHRESPESEEKVCIWAVWSAGQKILRSNIQEYVLIMWEKAMNYRKALSEMIMISQSALLEENPFMPEELSVV